MRFPPSFIERLRSHFLMSEVVSRRLPLKKFGREYKACCPFHSEKTPSFTVNDEKGFFHCFGCGAHGDAIEFIRRFERMSYPEAIESLANSAGIALPEVNAQTIVIMENQKRQLDIVEAACQWFEKQLHSARNADAFSYIEQRGLRPETIRQFRIGYAPDENSALHKYLTAGGYDVAQQIEAGLVSRSDSGSVYDRFRGRIIFPIRNSSGKVIAFGGRIISSAQNNSAKNNIAKYLNSPETELFKKGEILFNLDQARKPAREKEMIVVMEGYMDVVSAVQSGIDCAVAALGTAVTPQHLRLLWQSAKEPVFCLDGDVAGVRAMLRAAEIALPLLAPGYSLRFAVLPKGEDPDSYIQKNGKDAFETLLRHAKRLSQIIWETMSSQYNLSLAEGRAGLEGALKKLTDRISDPTVKQHFSGFFKKQLWETTSNNKKKPTNKRSARIEHVLAQDQSAALELLIMRMLKTLIIFPELLSFAKVEEFLSNVVLRPGNLQLLRDTIIAISSQAISNQELSRQEISHQEISHQEISNRNEDTKEDTKQAREKNSLFNAQAFQRQLSEFINEKWCDDFIKDSLKLPYGSTISADDAMVLWNETVSAYQIATMEQDLALLQMRPEALDEQSLKRLIDLQNTIRAAQNTRNFAPLNNDFNSDEKISAA